MFTDSNILMILAGLAAVYVFGAPLLVLMQFRKPAASGFGVVQADQLTEDARSFLDAAYGEFESLGFRFVCYVEFDLSLDLMGGYGMIMVHPQNHDLVLSLLIEQPMRVAYIEFSTEFEDGSEINTNNSRQLPDTALLRAGKRLFWFPRKAPDELYAAHLALCESLTRSAKRPPPGESGILNKVREGIHADFEHAVKRGVMRYDAHDEVYQLTVMGAYKMTWAQLFPFSLIVKAQKRAADRNVLARAEGR